MELIYKIVPEILWRAAERAGVFHGAPVDEADGFIHFSTGAQLAETARRHFAGQTGLLLVTVEADKLGPALAWEPSRGGDLFPHLYGPLPLDAALSVGPLPLGPDGLHVVPALAAGDARAAALEAAGWKPMTDEGFVGLVGPVWTRRGPDGQRSYAFLPETRHLNRGGIVHGGMLMTFADQALGMFSWESNGRQRQATIQLDTHFVSAVQAGEVVEARCRVVRRTRSVVFLAADLVVGDRVAATANGIWKLLGVA